MRARWIIPVVALSLLLTWLGLVALSRGGPGAVTVTSAAPGATPGAAPGAGPGATPGAGPGAAPDAMQAAPRIEIHGEDLFLGSFRATLPEKTVAYGVRTILLPGVPEETAHIQLVLCPGAIPVETGCIGNHRAPAGIREITVAGLQTRAYTVDFSQPSAANDPRVWQEIHTFLPLPSGHRLDIMGVVLKESGKEKALNEAYQRLLGSVRRDE